MLKNYFRIGWRNLIKNKGFTSINLFGLTIGMTCTILIFLWVKDEMNYNKFQASYHEIYQVMAHRNFNNQTFTDPNMVLPLAEAIENEIPQIEQAVITSHSQPISIRYGTEVFSLTGRQTSPNFFDLFTVDFLKKNQINPINEPSFIVLTESTAKIIFGDEDPINKVLSIGSEDEVKVTAVVADMPDNSSIQFDYLMSFDYSSDYIKENMAEWTNSSWVVYLKSLPQADLALIDKQINAIKVRNDPGDKEISTYFSFPMSKWRLQGDFDDGINTGGMIAYVRMFTIIAIIILLIACVNFMNLSTARSEKRAKEVGIRKTLGSLRKQLIYQFFTESIILALLAFCLTLVVVLLLLPSFNQLVDKQLTLPIFEPSFWLGALIIICFTGLVAGSYPALFLSSFNPIKVLKGTFIASKNAVLPRQVLIVFQFAVSILLISATIIVYQQISLIKNRDLGYDPNNLISIPGSEDTQNNFEVIKHELLQTGMISAVTRTMAPMTQIWWRTAAPGWEGKPDDLKMIFTGLTTDVDYAKTMDIKMQQGKDFSGTPADSSYVLLNETAVAEMGLENPLGMNLSLSRDYTVLGVTDNVIQGSPFEPVEPMMIFFDPDNSRFISLRLLEGVPPKEALASIEGVFRKYNPTQVFEFEFVDKEFEEKFINEDLVSKLSNIFAAIAIFICCIGLAGLAAFTIEKRIREIGMRKILGATLRQLVMLISKEFLKLVSIAFLIAVPLTWWSMYNWLQNYEYQIEISLWLFAVVGASVLLLALVVVSANTINAAIRNPMESLRSE